MGKVRDLLGGLDILVTNAGAAAQGGFLDLDDDAWPAGFGLKLFANLRVIRHAWPMLKLCLAKLPSAPIVEDFEIV